MTVLTNFAANMSAADARDTLNQMLADVVTLKAGGNTTPPASTAVYDATSTDTGFQKLAERSTVLAFVNGENVSIQFGTAANGGSGYRIYSLAPGYLTGAFVSADGTEAADAGFNFAPPGGLFEPPMPIRLELFADHFELYVRDETTAFKNRPVPLTGGTYVRHQPGGAAARTIMKNVS